MCGRGERLALALARENVNSLMESSSQSRVEVDVYELKNDSQYSTTDTSESQGPGRARAPDRAGPADAASPLSVCQILPKGVVAVIGPASSPASGSAVSHICGEKEVGGGGFLAGVGTLAGVGAHCGSGPQIPHLKVGPEETPRLPYLRVASVTLHPSNEDLSRAIGSMLRSFGSPTASIVCARAECEFGSARSLRATSC